MEEVILDTKALEWDKLRKFPGEGQAKVLRDEAGGGAKSMIVKLPAGGKIVPHTHLAEVQHYVLEGEYESDGKAFPAGTYRLLPKNANLPPISTKNGVVVLMIYDPITS
jgi:hypothetical protein